MPLNLSVSDGEITPYLKYNAKAGRFYVKPASGGEDVEVHSPRIAIDMANIRTGWIFYAEGTGPEKVWDAAPDKAAPRPPGPKKWKRGFEVMVIGNDPIPGIGPMGLREWSSTANNAIAAILKMYDAYEQGLKTNPGKVPFYNCKNVIAVQGSYGTNYEPEFVLLGWVDRAKVRAFDEHAETRPTATPTVGTNGRGDTWDERNPPPPTGDELSDSIPF